MRQVFLIAELGDVADARALADEAKKNLDAREDLRAQATMLVKNGRVSVVGVPQKVADQLRAWCGERRKSSRLT